MRSRRISRSCFDPLQREPGVVALPFPLDQCGARRLERLGEPPGGDLGAHGFHAQRLALVGRRRQLVGDVAVTSLESRA